MSNDDRVTVLLLIFVRSVEVLLKRPIRCLPVRLALQKTFDSNFSGKSWNLEENYSAVQRWLLLDRKSLVEVRILTALDVRRQIFTDYFAGFNRSPWCGCYQLLDWESHLFQPHAQHLRLFPTDGRQSVGVAFAEALPVPDVDYVSVRIAFFQRSPLSVFISAERSQGSKMNLKWRTNRHSLIPIVIPLGAMSQTGRKHKHNADSNDHLALQSAQGSALLWYYWRSLWNQKSYLYQILFSNSMYSIRAETEAELVLSSSILSFLGKFD